MSKRRVVVTGLGIVSPVGNDVQTSWDNIVSGRSGIGPITSFDASQFPTRFGGEIRNFEITEYLKPKDARKMDPFIHYGMAASSRAMQDAGFDEITTPRERIGVAVGAGIGGLKTIEKNAVAYSETKSQRKISPFFVPSSITNMISGNLSIHHDLRGPNIAIVTACTTATHNIGVAARMIAYGDADVMVAGGAEMAMTPLGLGGFCSARAVSTRNDDPEAASRPWDRDRDGFVLSNGAGVIVIEEYEHAKKRGAPIYAEIVGFGMSADAYHITAPQESGAGARHCMLNALSDAGIAKEDVDHLNAHGTSTPLGDKAESEAVKQAFGDLAYKLAVSSTKSMTGHLLGAAGGVEAIFSILAIRDNVAPPTINHDNPDPECDLDYVPNEAREMNIDVALSNSFGFGGTNGSLIFRRVD